MSKQTKQFLQIVFFIGLGIFLVYYQINNLTAEQKQRVVHSFRNANLFWIIIPMGISLLSHFTRAARWKLLIDTTGDKVHLKNSFYAVMIGYLANGFLPRLGEIIRCGVLGKKENIKFETLVGTVVAERIFDFLFMLLIVAITIIAQYQFLFDFLNEELFRPFFNSIEANRIKYALVFGIVIFIILFIYFVLGNVLRSISANLSKRFENIKESFAEGLTTILKLPQKALFIGYSVIMWLCYFFMSFLVFKSLTETKNLSVDAGLSVLTAGSLGLVIPTPGGIGSYHQFVSKTLQLYEVSEATGISLSWLIWLTNFMVILLFGLLSLLLINYTKQSKITE